MKYRDQPRQATTPIIMVFALASLIWYASFLFARENIGHPIAYFLLILAEIIGMSQLFGAWATILFSSFLPEKDKTTEVSKTALRKLKKKDIAVFVPVAGEPHDIINRTLTAASRINMPHRTIVLDDGDSLAVKELADDLRIEYLSRPVKDDTKAGNINYGLSQIDAKYVAIFDSDHVPDPAFLSETLPHLLADSGLAFVQTPQYFDNSDGFISGGTAEAQEIFYRYIQIGKNAFSSAFCVGTNVIFRRQALDEIGGIYNKSNSEDIWTSILLHEKGWRSLFLPQVLATGKAPDTTASYFRQQFRWARGGFEIFFTHNPLFRRLTLDQKLQYLHSTTHFLTGFSVLIFFILPLLYVYFDWKPINAPGGFSDWAIHFIPYYVLIFATLIHLLGRRPLWRSFVVALTAFPAHIAAFISVLTGLNLRWSVTGVITKQTDHIKSVAPHILLMLLSIGAIPVLLTEKANEPLSFMISLWLLWNSAALLSICKRAFPAYVRRQLHQTATSTKHVLLSSHS